MASAITPSTLKAFREAMAHFGRQGGKSKSPAKKAASRRNGKLYGGRKKAAA
jgi:hypothetical protein